MIINVFLLYYRSMFYTSLGRLLMVDLGEDEEKFDAFMMPLTQSFESLGQVLLNQSSGYNSEEVVLKYGNNFCWGVQKIMQGDRFIRFAIISTIA